MILFDYKQFNKPRSREKNIKEFKKVFKILFWSGVAVLLIVLVGSYFNNRYLESL